jgi:hypothetical protein
MPSYVIGHAQIATQPPNHPVHHASSSSRFNASRIPNNSSFAGMSLKECP